jgi:hypothetical protein
MRPSGMNFERFSLDRAGGSISIKQALGAEGSTSKRVIEVGFMIRFKATVRRTLFGGVAGFVAWAGASRGDAAAPYYAAPYYAGVRYPFGPPSYFGYYYRPWYLTPYRYSYYAAKYGWLYPRYYKPYHPYPMAPWYGYYGPRFGPVFGPAAYGYGGPLVLDADSALVPFAGELPPAVKYAGCDYW